MLDWLVNIPMYGIAVYILAIALHCGLKEGKDDKDR
jgi:hypothetical protein